MAKKSVLITGCSEDGMGYGLAQAFAEKGYHVFATARNPAKAASLAAENVEVLPLDVVSAESIATCLKEVRGKTGGRLDILVNNAGIANIMPILDTPVEMARAEFEVNYWGSWSMIQAFAPILIEAKGTIVNISSMAAVARIPWQATYNASKAALSSLSETLRLEIEPLGVSVVTVQLGLVATNLYVPIKCELPADSHYQPIADVLRKMTEGEFDELRETPLTTGRSIVSDVMAGWTGQLWRGGNAGTVGWTWWLLPRRLFDRFLKQSKGFDQWKSS